MKISVKVRASKKPEGKVAGFADVVLELPEGRIELNSLSVFKPNGKAPWVAPPASKGEKKFFPFYRLAGELRKRIETAILVEYDRQAHASAPPREREPGEDG
jgi:hypothetical protein